MRQVIYIDVLLAVNLFINYFLLVGTAKFLYIGVKRIRLLLGACLGAIYSLYIFLPEPQLIFSIIIKVIMAVTVVLVSFGLRNIRSQIKVIACFYSMSFAFSGVMFAMWCLFEPSGLMINNGVVYFNISPVILVLSTVVSYIIIQGINRVVGKQKTKEAFCKIKIRTSKGISSVKAKVDTGNSLREPFSNLPVIVVRGSAVKQTAPQGLLNFLKTGSLELESNDNTYGEWGKAIRMIPFKTVSGEGLFPAFKAEGVVINEENGLQKEAYIALCPDSALDEDFEALVNPELMD